MALFKQITVEKIRIYVISTVYTENTDINEFLVLHATETPFEM